jgi:hypothetical protein
MVLHEVVNLKRWYVTAAIAPALAAVYYLRSLLATYGRLPEQVPVHFGLDGQPNGWMSCKLWPVVSLVLMVVIEALLFTTQPGIRRVPTLMYWGVCGLLAGAFSEINYSAADGRAYGFRPMLLGVLGVLCGGILITLALAGWWRVPG